MRSSTRSASRALLLGLACALSATALGAPKARPDADEVKARALFKEAQTAYDLGEFGKALGLYSDAYKLKALPGFLFNIAQCHRQLGNLKDAQFFYGRYIDNSSPKEPNVERARELLEDMKRQQAEAEKKAEEARLAEEARQAELKRADAPLASTLTPADAPPPPPLLVTVEDPPVYKKGWFWAVVGGGVAVVAAGTVTAIVLTRPQAGTPPVRPATTLPDIR